MERGTWENGTEGVGVYGVRWSLWGGESLLFAGVGVCHGDGMNSSFGRARDGRNGIWS